MQDYLLRAQAAGHPVAAAQAQLNELYQQFGRAQPLATVSSAQLQLLAICAVCSGARGWGSLALALHGGAWRCCEQPTCHG